MPLDLTGLGLAAGGAMQGYDAAQARKQALIAATIKNQDAQKQQQALALMLSGVGDAPQGAGAAGQPQGQPPQQIGAPAPVPMSPGPQMGGGAPQPGMTGPMPQPGSQPVMAPRVFSPGQPVSPPMQGPGAPPPPPGPGGQGAQQQGQGGQGQPGQPGSATPVLTQLAKFRDRIMAANPDADPGAVAIAAMQLAELAAKDSTNETKLLAQQMLIQGRAETTMAQINARMDVVQAQQGGANARAAGAQAGADKRASMRTDASAAHQQSQQAFTIARDQYMRGFAGMKEADKVKARGALQKWQGALANQRTIINAKPDDADAQKQAQAAVDTAEDQYNAITVGGGGEDAAPSKPGAPAPAAGGAPAAGVWKSMPGDPSAPPAGAGPGAQYSPSQKSWWWQPAPAN